MYTYGTTKLLFFQNFESFEGDMIEPATKVWLYDIAQKEFTSGPNLSEQRQILEGCSVGTRFYIFSGHGEDSELLNSLEYLEIEEQGAKW